MAENELISETVWAREYRVGPDSFRLESKFASDALSVPAGTVRSQWAQWNAAEQISFVTAFIIKPELTSEDQSIITFLLEHATEPVWVTLANLLPRYSDRERAVSFLLGRVAARTEHAAGYFRALASLGDRRAIPALRQQLQEYHSELAPIRDQQYWSAMPDYLACCAALWRLEESPEHEAAIRELFSHPDADVRRAAQQAYVERKLYYLAEAPGGRPPGAAGGPEPLLQETEWSRVYLGQSGFCWYASKFLTDGLQVSAASLRARWPQFPLEEQAEFAQAFCQKRAFDEEDRQVLQLIVEQGAEFVRFVAFCQWRHIPGWEPVLAFLLERLAASPPRLANYCETLRLIGDVRAVAPLQQLYERYRRETAALRSGRLDEVSGYLQCCRALWSLTGSTQYEMALQEFLGHPDESVRREARRLLPRAKL
jgi:hypothetical protein